MLYKTGDIARYNEDGTIQLFGRIDHQVFEITCFNLSFSFKMQVKIRGYRIEILEIESVIRKIPNVEYAAVMVANHASGGKQLIGFVQLSCQVHTFFWY